MSDSIPVTVLGVTYPSKKKTYRHFNIDGRTVRCRLRAGWTVDDAYSLPPKTFERTKLPYKRGKFAHKRVKFVAKNPDISLKTYALRLKAGWSISDAQTLPLGARNPNSKPKCFVNGAPYATKIDAYTAYSTTPYRVKVWMEKGLNWEQAVGIGLFSRAKKSSWDHTTTCEISGKIKTVYEHCRKYDVTPNCVRMRVSRGMSLAHAITAPSILKWRDAKYSLYIMTNLTNLMSYVGITRKPDTRFSTHWWGRNHPDRRDLPLYVDMRKHGKKLFSFAVIDTFDEIDEMVEAEPTAIAKFDTVYPNGYNMTTGGEYMASHITGYTVMNETFDCKQDALDHYGITHDAIVYRRKQGWTEREVWETPLRDRRMK